MLYEERASYMLKKLEKDNIIKTNELVDEMNVSIDTIRRDLKRLEDEGRLICIRGGACSCEDAMQYSPFAGRQIINEDLKRKAAKKAVTLIHSGDVIALNAGTTNAILADELLRLSMPVTVVTNNLSVISTLTASSHVDLIVPGGNVDKEELAIYGHGCVDEISSYVFDICFLSINAYHSEYGFSDFRFDEIDIIKAMIKNSRKSVAVLDSSKLNKLSKKIFLPCDAIDVLISDTDIV